MLLSLREMVVWLGLGPFEAFIHSTGAVFFILLLTLQVENALNTSWHVIFIPLYVAMIIDCYYSVIQFTRIVLYAIDNRENIRFAIFYFFLLIIRLGTMLYAEIEIANFLNGSTTITSIVPPFALFFFYLLFRLIPIFRLVKNQD
jgi:hypothetical protein